MKKNPKTQHQNPLPLIALAVVIAAAAITLTPKKAATAESTGILIPVREIGTEADYFDYNANGITVQALAVRASDDTIRLALNTCQVCNGSPYAYFEQNGDWFICQNCGNRFASTEIGIVRGGCRPVPITEEIYTEQDGVITIPASFLEESASLFRNWKNF